MATDELTGMPDTALYWLGSRGKISQSHMKPYKTLFFPGEEGLFMYIDSKNRNTGIHLNLHILVFLILIIVMLSPIWKTETAQAETTRGSYLTGQNAVCYEALSEMAEKAAAGEINKAEARIPLLDLGVKDIYKSEELGIDENASQADASEAAKTLFDIDPIRLRAALLNDHPYEMYWFDRSYDELSADTRGIYISLPALKETGEGWSFEKDHVSIYLKVSKHYGSTYSLDTARTSQAAETKDRCIAIVQKYAELSDIEKLTAYKDEIIALTDYNSTATSDLMTGKEDYGDPWQLIYVFDGDPETKVVCEGYAKAFQYLCQLSEFEDRNLDCHCVTGLMSTSAGSDGEAHMWNVVHMDGKNYLVDVTNSEVGYPAEDGQLFMAGASGDVSSGYQINWPDIKDEGEYLPTASWSRYEYNDETTEVFGENELILSELPFELDNLSKGKNKAAVTFALYGDSIHRPNQTGMNAHTWENGNLTSWINKKRYEVPEGINLYDAIRIILTKEGYLWDKADKGDESYLRWIRRSDTIDLAEGDNGDDTGWLAMLNGKHVGLQDPSTMIKAGDDIVIHYSDDRTTDTADEEAEDPGEKTPEPPAEEKPTSVPEKDDKEAVPAKEDMKEDTVKTEDKQSIPEPEAFMDEPVAGTSGETPEPVKPGSSEMKGANESSGISRAAGFEATVSASKLRITVAFDKAKDADGYSISWRKAGSSSWKYAWTKGDKGKYIIKKLKAKGLYQVRAAAMKYQDGNWMRSKWTRTRYCYMAKTGCKLKEGSVKRSIKVRITKKVKGATGYQIIYSLNKSMKPVKIKSVKGEAPKTVKLRSLKTGRKYYVKVRPYKVRNGKKYLGESTVKKHLKAK